MGNREDLLAGARRCLVEKGWGQTTVRDIAQASGGVSHAAIGYHFGSREALLTEALVQATAEWGSEFERVVAAAMDSPPAEQFAAMWTHIITSFDRHRPLWVATFEAFAQAERSPEVREHLVAGQREGRRGLAALLTGVEEDTIPDGLVRGVGSVQVALLCGVMMQWLNDPGHAPSSEDLVAGIRAIAARLGPAGPETA
ncbi:TetR/AcrR family transcriptional regulator [Sphaerisporangium corydalis]|uniref:TetR/AcrR family transcriptional regulator n=1 Tax=Sphaerisporangium corydalis TaxID=1441875 RepID=A0ABV9EUL7_9ACTN|nr:TetR/AcrR family transcriptional regulator [Sphaerisporangium corydalis]